MKSSFRKSISVLLSLLMAFSCVCFAAAGDEIVWTEVANATALNNAIGNGAHIKLTADITGSSFTIPAGTTVTIDLAGHKIDRHATSFF